MGFQDLTLKNKLITGFAPSVVAVLTLGIIAFVGIKSILSATHWVDHTHEVIRKAQIIKAAMIDMETGMRGFLVAGKDEFLESYEANFANFDNLITDLKQTVDDNPGQVTRLEEVRKLKEDWITQAAEPQMNLRRDVVESEAAVAVFEELSKRTVGKRLFDAMRGQFAELKSALEAREDLQGLYILQAMLMDMINQETGQRGFLLTGLEESLEPFVGGIAAFKTHRAALDAHFGQVEYDPAPLQTILKKINELSESWTAEAATPEINARRDMNKVTTEISDVTAFMETGAGKQRMDVIRAELKAFIAEEQALIEKRSAEASSTASMVSLAAVLCSAFAVVLAIFLGHKTIRVVSEQVGGEPELLSRVSRQVANGDLSVQLKESHLTTGIYASTSDMVRKLQDLLTGFAQATNTQATATQELVNIAEESRVNIQNQQDSIDQVAVAIEEMQATSAEVAANTGVASEAANEVRDLVDRGNSRAESSVTEIEQLRGNLDKASTITDELSESANNISNILVVIRNIADQTNLLALNAAIEAARAGEQGRGFAVVADEVRSLAQNTQNSTSEIESMIMKVQEKAKASAESMSSGRAQAESIVDLTNELKNDLTSIQGAMYKITDMTTQIASASEEQSATTSEMAQRSTEIRSLSEKNASGSLQVATAAKELKSLSGKLQQDISYFKLS